jgi:hypothetical protein
MQLVAFYNWLILGSYFGVDVVLYAPTYHLPNKPRHKRREFIMSIRPIKSISEAVPTMEGAGVHLHRAFGFHDPSLVDPFLLFDDFRNDDPAKYENGFPWHPHRGIETIT